MPIRNSSRRSFVKLLAAAPLLTQIAARDLYAQAASAVGRDPRNNVYSRLGGEDRHQLSRHMDVFERLA